MKIKSSFKDYYDFISHQYGGGDPNIVYVRDRIKANSDFGKITETITVTTDFYVVNLPYKGFKYNDMPSFSWLVIAGKLYLMAESQDVHTFRIITSEDFSKYFCRGTYKKNKYLEYIGLFNENTISLSKIINTPVFTILNVTNDSFRGQRKCTVEIDTRIPILANTGVPSIIDAFTMYQDIAYFIGNTLRDAPDIAPPVSVSNDSKITQHGFDKKISFRHRS
jgi:hypothetical protein